MGIYAKGEQSPTTRVSDTPQDRYGELANPNDIGGSALGQVIADTKATSTSANDTAGAMANDLSALESRVDGLETNGAPPTAHTHETADITDSTTYADADSDGGRALKTGYDGFIHSRTNPTNNNHLARKGYVDQQVEGLETVISANGTGWRAYKRAGVVTLTLAGATSELTLPTGWRPPGTVYFPVALGNADTHGYFSISNLGVVTLNGTSGGVYSTATYVTL